MDRKAKIALVVGVVIGSILGIVAIIYIISSTLPAYRIISHNGVLRVESVYPETRYNYTVYVEIEKVRGDSGVTVYCELTREDLTKITKQSVHILHKGEAKIIAFFFSNEDLKGRIPNKYRVYIS